MNVSFRQLRAFLAVVQSGGFTEASRRLHLSPSALSLLLKELETELGFRLLDRTTRKVNLSQAGADFLPLAERVVGDLEFAMRNASELGNLKRGSVRACAPQILACSLLIPAMGAYSVEHPEIQLRPVDTLLDEMLDPIIAGRADFTVGPDIRSDRSIERQPLFDSPFVLWCANRHPLAKKPSVCWRDLKTYRIATMGQHFTTDVMPQLKQWSEELTYDPFYKVGYVTSGLAMAAAGLAITVGPAYISPVARTFPVKMVLLSEPKLVNTIYIYKHRDRALSPAAASFADFLRGFVAKQPIVG